MRIRDLKNPWRDKWQNASFRGERFFVEGEARAGGRRVAVHEYPKRNVPYSEDMGRMAVRLMVQGYLIGPKYLEHKDKLITALEKDGPGMLRLPLPYQMADLRVMVQSYSVQEGRERGGFCMVEMGFVEYGDPEFRENISTTGQIDKTAAQLESELIKERMDANKAKKMSKYAEVYGQSGKRQFLTDRILIAPISGLVPDEVGRDPRTWLRQ